jgi:hypothetical protein
MYFCKGVESSLGNFLSQSPLPRERTENKEQRRGRNWTHLDPSARRSEEQNNCVVVCILEISGEFNILYHVFNHALQRIHN